MRSVKMPSSYYLSSIALCGTNLDKELRSNNPSPALRAPSPHAWGKGKKEWFFGKLNIFLTLCIINTVNAASVFPRGCEVTGFGYNQNNLILNETGEQAYYLIQNRSNATVELERDNTNNSFMTPPLQASLAPMNWGAFASDEKNLNFKCYSRPADNASVSIIDCREVLEVCQYPRVKFALSNMGNYWISSNKEQNAVIQDSVAKGIYLKW